MKISLNKTVFYNIIDTLMIQWTYFSNLATIMLLQTSIFDKLGIITKMSYFKNNVNLSKRVGMDGVFLGLAGLLGFCRLVQLHREGLVNAVCAAGLFVIALACPGHVTSEQQSSNKSLHYNTIFFFFFSDSLSEPFNRPFVAWAVLQTLPSLFH